ncbi:SipW-dependent-type signal peptide-containing protein [Solicola sp. PLA-1-18]|uniref:SipW-dependent-type signal peptide-containing protein n=1 Tax=Solicola sp. PLA-1-18 TaxID=3380532 RepID=UPI003B777CC1
MIRGAPTLRDRVLALLSLGLVLGLGAVGTSALWTDTSTATSSFATGTATLRLKATNEQTTAFGTLDVSGLAPGSTKAAVITVRNRGTVPLIYSIGVGATNADSKNLAANLVTVIRTDAGVVGAGTSSTCGTGSSEVVNRTGLAGGAVTVGGQLNPPTSGADQDVCVQVGLSSGAPSSLQGATTTATFTFTGTTFG